MATPEKFAIGTLLRDVPEVEEESKDFTSVGKGKTLADFPYIPPKQFDGRVVWRNYLSPIRMQGKCGNCWAYAVTGMLADRFAMQTGGQVKPSLSATMLTMCEYDFPSSSLVTYPTFESSVEATAHTMYAKLRSENRFPSCFGNSLYRAVRYTYRYGVTTKDCIDPFFRKRFKKLQDFTDIGEIPFCADLIGNDFVHCADGKTAARFYSSCGYYTIAGDPRDDGREEVLMFEIFQWGPVAVGFDVHEDFYKFSGKGVYVHDGHSKKLGGHAVRLVGWGEEDGIPYWIAANSWGTKWGDNGYFKIKRGTCNIERNIACIIPNMTFPHDPSFTASLSTGFQNLDLEDQRLREFFNVDVKSGYPYQALMKIASGILKSDTGRDMFDSARVPAVERYTAGRLPEILPIFPLPPKIDFLAFGVVYRPRQTWRFVALLAMLTSILSACVVRQNPHISIILAAVSIIFMISYGLLREKIVLL